MEDNGRCLASVEVVPGVLKRCQLHRHPKNTLHYFREAVRSDGKYLVVGWDDRRNIISSEEMSSSISPDKEN